MRIRGLLIVGRGVAVAACQTVQTTQPGAVGVDRKQHMLVSEEEIEKGAQEAYHQELDKAKQKRALNTDQQTYQARADDLAAPHSADQRRSGPMQRSGIGK